MEAISLMPLNEAEKSLDAQLCHTVVLRSWYLTVCWVSNQRIGCILCGHIQILVVHRLCSGFYHIFPCLLPTILWLPFWTMWAHKHTILMITYLLPLYPVLSFPKHQGKHLRKAFQHPFCEVRHFSSFLWHSLLSCIHPASDGNLAEPWDSFSLDINLLVVQFGP